MAFNYDDHDLGVDDDEEDDDDEEVYDSYEDYSDYDDYDEDEDDDEQDSYEDDDDDYEDDEDLDDSDDNDLSDDDDFDGETTDSDTSSNGTDGKFGDNSANNSVAGGTNPASAGTGTPPTSMAGAGATGGTTAGSGVAAAGGSATTGAAAGSAAAGGAAASGAATGSAAAGGLAICWPILIVVVVIILILIVSAAITVATENADEENGTITYQTITDENFYGVRTAYIDETELTAQLQQSYKDYCIDLFKILKENPEINLALDTDTSNLNEATKLALNNLSVGIGNIIATGNSTFEGVEFSSLYANIQYFGIADNKLSEVQQFIINYLISNNLLTSNSTPIQDLIDPALQDARLDYIKNQCEKIMIKDISAGENGFGTIKTNLKGIIYLPKKQVTLSNLQYNIRVNESTDTVNMKIISNNGSTETILQEENADISWNENLCFSEFGDNTQVTIDKYGDVGSTENSLYLEGVSLFTLLKNGSTLSQKDGIFTWKPNEKCVYLLFESSNSFTINEFYISVE